MENMELLKEYTEIVKEYIEEEIEKKGFLTDEEILYVTKDVEKCLEIALSNFKGVKGVNKARDFYSLVGRLADNKLYQELGTEIIPAVKISKDNFERVQRGVQIVKQSQGVNNLKILVDQSHYSYVHYFSLTDYIKSINFTEPDLLPNQNYVIEMRKARHKILTLDQKYMTTKYK